MNCPSLATRDDGLCDEHRRAKEARRGSSTARNYGSEHRRTRKRLIRNKVGDDCPICGLPMLSGDGLEAEHSTPLRDVPTSVADRLVHARCNPRGGAGLRDQG